MMASGIVYSGSCSTVTTEKSTFLWILNTFSVLQDEYLVTPAFSAVHGDCLWCLDLRPNELKDNKKWVSLYLVSLKRVPLQRLSCKLVLINSKGSEIKSLEFVLDDYDGKLRGYSNFIKKDDLLKKLDNDLLKIHVNVTAVFSVKTTDIHKAVEIPSVASTLLKSRKFSDFVIRVQDTDIPVHKSILAVRSPVFEAMFNSDTKETELGRVELQDMELTAVCAMIEFFYVGKVTELDVPLALHLLKAADKYNVEDLMTYCSLYLGAHLCSSNAIEAAADDNNASDLTKCCVEFITENRHLIAMDDEQFKTLELRNKLLVELFRKIM